MKTNKKVIRLTESDLHNMISEAVKVALNELDPRTYASAAEKRRLQGRKEDAKKLQNAAIDSYNREFGDGDDTRLISNFQNCYCDYEHPISYTIQGTEYFDDDSYLVHNYTPYSGPYNDWVYTERYPGCFGKTWDKKKVPYLAPKSTRKSFLGYEPMSDDDDAHEATKKFINKKVGSKRIRVAKEMNKGNGEYIKGK